MTSSADVVVVGGGVIGASIAFHLSSSTSLRVVMCEQYLPATRGGTARSGGLLRMHHTDPFDAELAWRSLSTYARWSSIVGGDCGFVRTGFAMLVGPDHAARLHANVDDLRRIGVTTYALQPDEFAEVQPEWRLDGVGAIAYEPDSGYADPALATIAFVRAGARHGLEVWEGVRATGVAVAGDRVVGVETSAGRVDAHTVVLAGGAWASSLLAAVGIDVPLRTQHIGVCFVDATPLSERARTCACIDDTSETYFRPDGRRVLVGVRTDRRSVDPDLEPPVLSRPCLEEARARLGARVPALARSRIVGARSGFDGYTPDRHAAIGPVDGVDGLYVAVGFSGGGFKIAPAVGQAVTKEVAGGWAPELETYRPNRFSNERPVRPAHAYSHM